MPRTKVRITSNKKTAIHFRCAPCDFKRLCNIAEADRRSLSNLVEKIISDYLSKTETIACTTEDLQR